MVLLSQFALKKIISRWNNWSVICFFFDWCVDVLLNDVTIDSYIKKKKRAINNSSGIYFNRI